MIEQQRNAVVVFAIPRTGSTNLAKVMAGFENILSFEEVFHNEALYVGSHNQGGFSQFLKRKGVEFDDIYDPRIVSYFKRDVNRSFSLMNEYALERERSAFSVQIFHGHLPVYCVRQLLEGSRPPCIVLHRNPIDSFISNVKAAQTSKFENVDTTDISVSLIPQKYVEWYNNHAQFYGMIIHMLERAQAPYIVMKYDDLYGADKPHLSDQLLEQLEPLGVSLGGYKGANELMKQDRETDYARKVANWDDFTTKLRRRGLSGMLDAGYL